MFVRPILEWVIAKTIIFIIMNINVGSHTNFINIIIIHQFEFLLYLYCHAVWIIVKVAYFYSSGNWYKDFWIRCCPLKSVVKIIPFNMYCNVWILIYCFIKYLKKKIVFITVTSYRNCQAVNIIGIWLVSSCETFRTCR